MSDTTKAAEIRAGLVDAEKTVVAITAKEQLLGRLEHYAKSKNTLGYYGPGDSFIDQAAVVAITSLLALIEQRAAELAAERQRSDTMRVQRDGHAAELAEARASWNRLDDKANEWADRAHQAETRATTAESESDAWKAEKQRETDRAMAEINDLHAEADRLANERGELLREKERLEAEVDHQRSGKEKAQALLDVSIGQTSRANERSVALAELVGAAISIFENCSVQSGMCCCGDAMDNHPEPMDCGHSPVDHGEYASIGWLASAQSALENGPAGLADAHSKSPAPSSQSERIAVLEAALAAEREAYAQIAAAAVDNDSRADCPFDGGAGGMGYRKACYDIEESIRARSALAPLGEE